MADKKPTQKKEKNIIGKIIRWSWILFLAGAICVPIYIYSVSINFLNLYGELPSYSVLENPTTDLSSELYSSDDVLLGKYFRHDRTPIEYDDLSANLTDALFYTEDLRFQKHAGIDLRGLLRVFVKTIALGQEAGGGSTISQQLAKNLFNTRSKELQGLLTKRSLPSIVRMPFIKTKEWIVAVQLERAYTKEEILAMYLNTIEFGGNAYGIKVAAKTFFNTTTDSLNVQQGAMLVGMLNAPTKFNPVRNPENATNKREEVLDNLRKYDRITQAEFDSIKVLDLGLDYNVGNQNEGPAPYFRKVAGNWLRNWAKENGYDLYEDGLKIYTTINSTMQKYAEEAVESHMKYEQDRFNEHWGKNNPWLDTDGREIKGFLKSRAKRTPQYRYFTNKYGEKSDSVSIMMNLKSNMKVFSWKGEIDTLMSPMDSLNYYKRFLQTGFMAMDPHSGEIRAWVGGINHKYFKYDHVKQAKRQPGSTFKPFVYTAALEHGFSPCFQVRDVPVTFEVVGDPPTWTPPNANGKYTGELLSIRQGMAKSKNSITAFLMSKVGPETVVKYAKNMGIESPLDAVPSLCLGVSDVSLFELLGAYGVFVNQGYWNAPHFITRIEDKNGNIIQDFVASKRQALDAETAYLMLHMLRGGTEEPGGTARGLSRELRNNNEIGAKTGTTNNASDGWFMGLTKDLIAGTWVGGDERSIHYKYWAMGAGGRVAMPIWEKFMLKVYADSTLGIEKGRFPRPRGRLNVEIDCNRYNSIYSTLTDSTGVVDTVYNDYIDVNQIH